MLMTLRNVCLVAVAVVCTGCVSAEGVSLGQQPYINSGFTKYGGHPDRAETDSNPRVTGLILVGTVSALREFDEEDKITEYEKYARAFEAWGTDKPPELSAADFVRTMTGWTKIKFAGVPLLGAAYCKALVSVDSVSTVDFEPSLATFMLQTSSDLVAARTNSDGAFVIDSLLCKDDQDDFAECSRRYRKGMFDADSGLKIKSKLKTDPDGPRIDPVTYLLVNEEADSHAASLPSAD